jgi:hypothetical protein
VFVGTIGLIAADNSPTVRFVKGESVVTNPLPLGIVALAETRDENGRTREAAAVVVGPDAVAPVRLAKAGGRVRFVEVLDANITRRASIASCRASTPAPLQIADLDRKLETLESSRTPEATARVRAVEALANLELEQKQDEKDTQRHDPLRIKLQESVDAMRRRTDPAAEINIRMDKIDELTSDIVDVAMAWSEVNDIRLSNIRDEATVLEPILEQAKLALRIREEDLASAGLLYRAGQDFLTAAASALDRNAIPSASAPALRGRVEQPCAVAGMVDDTVRITLDQPAASTALIAELSFDRGKTQTAVLRRVDSTASWEGRMFWPPDAGRATVRARAPGSKNWSNITGRVASNRAPIAVAAEKARAEAKKIEKKLKNAHFRAVGGDNIKTIWVP